MVIIVVNVLLLSEPKGAIPVIMFDVDLGGHSGFHCCEPSIVHHMILGGDCPSFEVQNEQNGMPVFLAVAHIHCKVGSQLSMG